MEPTPADLLEQINGFIEERFAPLDRILARNLENARAAGLPEIHVSAAQGKLLYMLAKIAGARRVLEIGTLSGFSTTWLARALPNGGEVVTLEKDSRHAEVARLNLEGAAPGVAIDVRIGDAAASIEGMIERREGTFDLVFIDADKGRYVRYLELVLQLSRPGTVILADNVIRHGLVMDETTTDDSARGAQAYNAAVAAHPRLETIVLPIIREKIDGLAISLVRP